MTADTVSLTADTVCCGAVHPIHQAPSSLLELAGIIALGLTAVVALESLLTRNDDVARCHAL